MRKRIGALTLVFAFRYGKAIVVAPLSNAGAPLVTAMLSLVILGAVPGPLKIVGLCLALIASVAIAPLILIYVSNTFAALLICAWIVAFFPILSNTAIGLRSADHNLRDMFRLYQATPWQRLRYLLIPSALPYFMAALKIAGGLALIGAVVAEFVAGTAGQNTGLASRILESSFRNEIPRMFAALFLVSVLGVIIFLATSWLSNIRSSDGEASMCTSPVFALLMEATARPLGRF